VAVSGSNTIQVGATAQLAAMATYSDNTTKVATSEVTWSSSAPLIAVVSSSGIVTAISPGDLQINASLENKLSSFGVKVMPVALVSVAVSGQTSIIAGTTAQYRAVARYSDSSTKDVTTVVAWTSSDQSIATVFSSGLVTTLKAGAVIIGASMSGFTGTQAVTVLAALPTLVSVRITGETPLTASSNTAPFALIGKYSDGSERTLTPVTWASSDPSIARVGSDGGVTPLKAGNVQISGSASGMSASMTVTVVAPIGSIPWADLPPISVAGKAYLLSGLIDQFGVHRWDQPVITVWTQPGFDPNDLQAAFDLWQTALSGKVIFVFASDSASANIIVVWDSTITESFVCGVEIHSRYRSDGAIIGGIARYATRADCQGDALYKKDRLAHGLGHILGLGPHTAPGTDIMSSPDMRWVMSPLLVEVINWLYSVPPGTKPI
jgi:uncharacterized protein YjdB